MDVMSNNDSPVIIILSNSSFYVNIGIELSQVEGDLDVHYKIPISLTLRPSQPGRIQSSLYYQLLLPNSSNKEEEPETSSTGGNKWIFLCSFKFKGVYPAVTIIDVQTDGMTGSLSKSQVWSMLQIDRLVVIAIV